MLQVCLNYLKEKAAGLTGHIVHIQLQLNGPYLHRLSYICWLKRKTGMGNGHAAFKAPAGSVSLQLFIYNYFSYNICDQLSWMTSHKV